MHKQFKSLDLLLGQLIIAEVLTIMTVIMIIAIAISASLSWYHPTTSRQRGDKKLNHFTSYKDCKKFFNLKRHFDCEPHRQSLSQAQPPAVPCSQCRTAIAVLLPVVHNWVCGNPRSTRHPQSIFRFNTINDAKNESLALLKPPRTEVSSRSNKI